VLVAVLGAGFGGARSATASGTAARAPVLTLAWLAPTPADGATFTVSPGERLTVAFAAEGGQAAAAIWASGLAPGASLASVPGQPARAQLSWVPRANQLGTHVFVLAGRSLSGDLATVPRTIFVQVVPATSSPRSQVTPIGTNGVYRWAYLLHRTVARSRPSTSARAVARLAAFTSDDTVNLVLLTARATDAKGRIWYRVRLPILPNGSTGWVQDAALTTTRAVSTYLVVFRKLFTATLYRGGRPVFRTRVGVGKPYWPTPRGNFYIREVLTGVTDPMYGPVAFGTSARSGVLTDWHGGGGVIGIHGTDEPGLIPGRPSHGCVRVRNRDIERLYERTPIGTPLLIK
jgi:hypothetical protein